MIMSLSLVVSLGAVMLGLPSEKSAAASWPPISAAFLSLPTRPAVRPSAPTPVDGSDRAVTIFHIPGKHTAPRGIVVGPDGAVWFTEFFAGAIGRMSPAGEFSQYYLTDGGAPAGMTVGPDGALWFAENDAEDIGRITTSGQITEYPATAAEGITTGPDGALWFTAGTQIGRITVDGQTSFYPLNQWAGAQGITAGPDGALWFTEYGNFRIGRMTTDGVLTNEWEVDTNPDSIVQGPDHALWFNEAYLGLIGRITLSGLVTQSPEVGAIAGMTFGRDGSLYFAACNGGVGRMKAGRISYRKVPGHSEHTCVVVVTQGSGDQLWFGEEIHRHVSGNIGMLVE